MHRKECEVYPGFHSQPSMLSFMYVSIEGGGFIFWDSVFCDENVFVLLQLGKYLCDCVVAEAL